MKSYCWRNSRLLDGIKENKDKVWPEIQSKNQKQRKYDSETRDQHHHHHQSLENSLIGNNSLADNLIDNINCHQLERNLNYCDFPELGKIMSRRKNDFRKDPDAIVADDVIITIKEEGEDKLKTRKYIKRSERTNLFRINIQQVLEVTIFFCFFYLRF